MLYYTILHCMLVATSQAGQPVSLGRPRDGRGGAGGAETALCANPENRLRIQRFTFTSSQAGQIRRDSLVCESRELFANPEN